MKTILFILLCATLTSCHITLKIESRKKYAQRIQQMIWSDPRNYDTIDIYSYLISKYKKNIIPYCYVNNEWIKYDCMGAIDWGHEWSVCEDMGIIGITDSVDINGKHRLEKPYIFLSYDTARFKKLYKTFLLERKLKNQ